jgi:hypothetical protein
MRNGVGQVGRIPIDDRPITRFKPEAWYCLLGLMAAIDDRPLAEGIDGLRESVALFTLVEPGLRQHFRVSMNR